MRIGDIFQIPSYDNKIAFVYLGPDSAALYERVYAILESSDVFPDNQFSVHLCKDFILMHSLNRLKIIKVGKISLPALVDLNIYFATHHDDYMDIETMKIIDADNWITWRTDDEDSWKIVFSLDNDTKYFDGGSYPAHLLFENHNNDWQKMHREIMAELRVGSSND